MASTLDTAIILGKESTYGTPVTLTDAFEGQADSYKRSQEVIESLGFRGGAHGRRSDRRKVVNMGGEGTLNIDVLTKGFGFLAQGMFDTSSAPVQIGSTDAYTSTHETDSDDSGVSYTIQVQRVDTGSGTVRSFTHHGGVVTSWKLSHAVGGLLAAEINFDFEDVETDTAAGTPAYPADAVPFSWDEAVITVDGTPTAATSFEFNADLGMKTDRRFLRGSPLKKQPLRSTVPTYNGSIAMEFENTTEYERWVDGDLFAITATWTGEVIETGENFQVALTLPACQYTGDSPVSSLSDVTMITLPFDVLHNGTDSLATLEITSTDTAL